VFVVESRLASQHTTLPLQTVIELAHDANVPVVVDGAAQDQRLHEIIAAGADLVLSGVQKYLRGPTAGMVAGKKALVKAVSMQQQGIGRTMKPSKEALMGTLAAIHHRRTEQPEQLIKQYCETVELVANSLQTLPGVSTRLQPDPTNHLFSLLRVDFDTKEWPTPLPQMVADVATGDPILALAPHFAPSGYLLLEVHEMKPDEIAQMTEILREYQRTHAG
jgi:L-seryl-tRNA(Ser) seleniumtransferase